MHAIILAGGFGTRLRSVVWDVPKPLAPIGDKPFLALLIDFLARKGFISVTLSVHHDWQKIRDYFTENSPAIALDYAVEETPLGTGGAIAYALKKHKTLEPVFVINGDSFVQVDYQKLYTQHKNTCAKLTIVLREAPDTGRYGKVVTHNGIITSFASGETNTPGMINAGVYVMQPDVFSEKNLPAQFSFEKDFLPSHLDALKPQSFFAYDYFIDIGIPADYDRASKELLEIFSA